MSSKSIIVLIASLALAACGKTESKTVSYFMEHNEERTALIAKANDNPGKYMKDPDVINAVSAAAKERNENAMQDWTKKGKREVRKDFGKLH